MTPAQSPALSEISFFVRAPKPLDFCVRDRGKKKKKDETISPVCVNTRKCMVVCFYMSIHYIYIKYLYNTTRDTWGSPPGNSS